jgi:hypothetical protein
MEPVGLAIGIVGLAGLFSTCLDALDKFDSYRAFETDLHHLITQFEAEKLRFESWGWAVGILRNQASDDHHEALEDPQIRRTVDNLLLSIRRIGNDTDDVLLGADTRITWNRLLSRDLVQPRRSARSNSKRSRLNWALRDKAKCVVQIDQFGKLVQSLYNLVPPDGAIGIRGGHREPTAGNNASRYPDSTLSYSCFSKDNLTNISR